MALACERCGGEGRIYQSRYGGNDPDVWDAGECPDCNGTGNERCCEPRCTEVAVDTWVEEWGDKVHRYHLCADHMNEYRQNATDDDEYEPGDRPASEVLGP